MHNIIIQYELRWIKHETTQIRLIQTCFIPEARHCMAGGSRSPLRGIYFEQANRGMQPTGKLKLDTAHMVL